MAYTGNMTGSDWRNILVNNAQNIVNSVGSGYLEFKKWYAFTYGLSNAQIASLLSITEQEVADMHAAFNSFNELYAALNNGAVSTNDRLTIFLKFGF